MRTMNLAAYLERIGHTAPIAPDLDTLRSLHRAHVLSIPFENLDVQLRRTLTTSPAAAFTKIVDNGRGGWCYEQNGLFGWALSQAGFGVTRVAATVMRQDRGDIASGNHLCLQVSIPESTDVYLADVGFGGSMIAPIKLQVGEHVQPPYSVGLELRSDEYWRFSEDNGHGPFTFDFRAVPGDEDALSFRSRFLQTEQESSFVLNLVAQIRLPDAHRALRGRVLTTVTTDGVETQLLESSDELVTALREVFGLDMPEVARLWPRIAARHEDLFSDAGS